MEAGVTPSEWAPIVDTAVKVGLGAAITTLAGLWGAAKAHRRDMEKVRVLRRLELLEKIATDVELSTEAWRSVSRRLGTAYTQGDVQSRDMDDALYALVQPADLKLLETREHVGVSLTRLRLIGADRAADALGFLEDAMGDARDAIVYRRHIPTKTDFVLAQSKINRLITEFHQALQCAYREVK